MIAITFHVGESRLLNSWFNCWFWRIITFQANLIWISRNSLFTFYLNSMHILAEVLILKLFVHIYIAYMTRQWVVKLALTDAHNAAKSLLKYIQVNLFQKHLFLHQLTHNMTKDCSWKLQAQNIRRTCCVHKLFWMSKQK